MCENLCDLQDYMLPLQTVKKCGNSSVGRAHPCQGWGREFESRLPLFFFTLLESHHFC